MSRKIAIVSEHQVSVLNCYLKKLFICIFWETYIARPREGLSNAAKPVQCIYDNTTTAMSVIVDTKIEDTTIVAATSCQFWHQYYYVFTKMEPPQQNDLLHVIPIDTPLRARPSYTKFWQYYYYSRDMSYSGWVAPPLPKKKKFNLLPTCTARS